MTYEELLKINEEHKKNYLNELKTSIDYDKELCKIYCRYRLEKYNDGKWHIRNNVDCERARTSRLFDNLGAIYDFYDKFKSSYITNISVLNKPQNRYVYTNYDLTCAEYRTLIGILRIERNIDTIRFIKVENTKKELSKLVLKGGKDLWINNYFNIAIIELKNDIYVLSDCMIKPVKDLDLIFVLSRLNCKKLYIDNLDISRLRSLKAIFGRNFDLEELYLKNFDTSQVEIMDSMFYQCPKLQKVNIDSLNTKNVFSMSHMFYGCESLKKLDLRSFDTRKLKEIDGMFKDCFSLEELDISTWNTKKLNYCGLLFDNCTKLKRINGLEKLNMLRKLDICVGNCDYVNEKGFTP